MTPPGRLAILASAVLALGCAPPLAPIAGADLVAPEPTASPTKPRIPAGAHDREIAAMLLRVARAHGWSVRKPVAGQTVSRAEAIRLIVEKAERDIPRHVLRAQGELLGALGLIPPDYDFVRGMFAMIEQNVAGFYDPDDDTMYLVDDLDRKARADTLAHELVHALQDQHYDLGSRLAYKPGQLDRTGATSALAEGDAMSAMLDIGYGSAFKVSSRALHLMMTASVALSPSGGDTPRALQASLVAAYVDGFAFVQALRRRGGWAEVDKAWRDPPVTTEQLLHLDKYAAREPPLAVPDPPLGSLGAGWIKLDADVGGEQVLRITLEQWGIKPAAARAAAGWGGDRYLVATRQVAAGEELAVAWVVRFDDEAEAVEAEQLLKGKHPTSCQERRLEGPLAYRRHQDTLAFAAGPYRRDKAGKRLPARSTCQQTNAWLATLLPPPP